MVDREVNTQSLDYLGWNESNVYSVLRIVDFIFHSLG